MKKLIVIALALCAMTACHSDPQTTTPSLSLAIGTFGQLKVEYSTALTPDSISQEIIVNSTPELIRVVKRGTAAGGEEKVCLGAIPLTEDEFADIQALATEAHLDSYTPPEDCEMPYGTTATYITYQLNNGATNVITLFCEPEEAIAAIIDELDRIADASIPDCNTDQYAGAVEPTPEEEPEAVEETEPVDEGDPQVPDVQSQDDQV